MLNVHTLLNNGNHSGDKCESMMYSVFYWAL